MTLNFNLNIEEARKYKNPGRLLLSGNAVKIFQVREKLKTKQISIAITPEYKYDVWDANPQGEFSNSTPEAKTLQSLLENK